MGKLREWISEHKKWNRFYDEHKEEFIELFKEPSRKYAIGIFGFVFAMICPLIIFGIIPVELYFNIPDVAIFLAIYLPFLLLAWMFYTRYLGPSDDATERIIEAIKEKYHYNEREYDFPPRKTSDGVGHEDIIIEEPTDSDYDFVHLPQDQDQKE